MPGSRRRHRTAPPALSRVRRAARSPGAPPPPPRRDSWAARRAARRPRRGSRRALFPESASWRFELRAQRREERVVRRRRADADAQRVLQPARAGDVADEHAAAEERRVQLARGPPRLLEENEVSARRMSSETERAHGCREPLPLARDEG